MKAERDMQSWLDSLGELGCGQEMSEDIAEAVLGGMTDTAERLLKRYKRILLDNLHDCESKVDLADFLLWQLKKQNDERTVL